MAEQTNSLIARKRRNSWKRATWGVLFWATVGASLVSAAPPGWNQTWADEFEGTTVDTTKWDPILWTTPFNNEQQAYHPSRVTVSDGNLVLTADDANFGGKSYTSGKVESKYTQQYGRWEIRAKLPGTQGTWPAIWLLPDTSVYPWPSQGEIDIMENRGHQPELTSSAYHWGPNFQTRQFTFEEQEATNGGQAENYHDEFHTYAVEWDATKLRFFVDDVHYQTISNARTGGFLGRQSAPVETVLNVAVGGDFLGGEQPNGSSVWPQQMLIDYVRIYERDASPPPVVFRNGSFEEQGGSLAGWSTFGNVLPNVQTHHEAPALNGSETLKIFGQFNDGLNFSGVQQGISVSAGDSISATASALVRADDAIAGENVAAMQFDFYSEWGAVFGSAGYLGSSSWTVIADAATTQDQWVSHEISATVPADTVEARVVLAFVQPANDGGAIHIDDVSFINNSLELNADADSDGDVDGADFLSWQRGLTLNDGTSVADGDFNFDGVVDAGDLSVWETSYVESSTVSAAVVPEPSSLVLMMGAMFVFFSPDRSFRKWATERKRERYHW